MNTEHDTLLIKLFHEVAITTKRYLKWSRSDGLGIEHFKGTNMMQTIRDLQTVIRRVR